MHDPKEEHLAAAKHVLRYLNGTQGQGILPSSLSDLSFTSFATHIGQLL